MVDADDTVELTDLEVIQQFSLAVRGARARRADVIAALEADLAHLGGRRPARAAEPTGQTDAATPTRKAPATRAAKAPAATAAKPAKRAPAKKATRSRA